MEIQIILKGATVPELKMRIQELAEQWNIETRKSQVSATTIYEDREESLAPKVEATPQTKPKKEPKKTKVEEKVEAVREVTQAFAEEIPILPDPKADKTPIVTIDMCRAKLKEVFNKKGQTKAMEILKKFGNVRSITEVPPSSYIKFKQVCEAELN